MAEDKQTWTDRSILNRLVRMYAHYMCGGNFHSGWKAFYRELYYKKGINLNARKGTGTIIEKVSPEEWRDMIAVAAAMCEASGIDLPWSINETSVKFSKKFK